MAVRTLRQRLAAHIAIRLVVATVLLGSAVVVQLREPGAWPISPFFFLIGLTYAVSLGFIGSLRVVDRHPWLTDVHFGIARSEAGVVHHLLGVVCPALGKRVAYEDLAEFRLRTICVQKLDEMSRVNLVNRREQ